MRRAELSLIPNRVAVPKLALIFLTTFLEAVFFVILRLCVREPVLR